MRRMRALLPILGIVALAFLFVSCEMLAELFVPIEGRWKLTGTVTVEGGGSGSVTATMELERDGAKDVKGEISAAAMGGDAYPGPYPVDVDGSIDGNSMELEAVFPSDTMTVTMSMEGEVDGDECEGDFTVTMTGTGYTPQTGTGTFTMRKD